MCRNVHATPAVAARHGQIEEMAHKQNGCSEETNKREDQRRQCENGVSPLACHVNPTTGPPGEGSPRGPKSRWNFRRSGCPDHYAAKALARIAHTERRCDIRV